METSTILNNEKQTNFIDLDNKEINNRWNNIKRLYFPEDVHKLRGTINIEYSFIIFVLQKTPRNRLPLRP